MNSWYVYMMSNKLNGVIYIGVTNNIDESVKTHKLEKWKRDWKLKLLEELNPNWMDITLSWNLDYKRNRNVKE